MTTLLCCIGRKENRYIREYVEWYKHLGFTNIVIYDNNYDGEDNFRDVIGDYIDSGFVIIKDYRNRTICQHEAYNECYREHGDSYDWIAFFDCDEFLTLPRKKDINTFLSSILFRKYDMIHVNWMSYGDSENIYYEDKPLTERFPSPVKPYDFKKTYNFPDNNHIKSIVRGGLKTVLFGNRGWSHTPSGVATCCTAKGIACDPNSPFTPFDFTEAYLRHYVTKSTEEYVDKLRRGFPDQEFNPERFKYLVELYFKINTKTQEKMDYFNEKLGMNYAAKRDDVQIFTLCYDKKDYEFMEDSVITPLQCGAANGKDVCKVKDNTGDNISGQNYVYIENTGVYWIWKNVKNAKYKGNMQYRRLLEGVNENMNFNEVFKNYDVITCVPFNHPEHKIPKFQGDAIIPADTVREGYTFSNCGADLDIMEKVVKELYPDYAESWDKYINNGENLYYSCGYVLRAEDYDRYAEFLFRCGAEFLSRTEIRDEFSLYLHVAIDMGKGLYPKIAGHDPHDILKSGFDFLRWEKSILGFLGERLWTLWVQHNFTRDRIMEVPFKKVENQWI